MLSARMSVAALACTLVSCAYINASTTQYVGVPRHAPVDPATVKVLPAEPVQPPHDRLGEILLDISLDPAPSVTEIEQRLREEGAKFGASAVFVVRDQIMPGTGRRLIAVAIRSRQ
jgi:hypothetical protein